MTCLETVGIVVGFIVIALVALDVWVNLKVIRLLKEEVKKPKELKWHV